MAVDTRARVSWMVLLSLCAALTLRAQDAPVPAPAPTAVPAGVAAEAPRRLQLSLDEAVRLATLNNSALRARYFDHLVERARIEEAKGEFDPTFFAEASTGKNEVVFPQIFPTGGTNPDGSPEFFQTIVNDRTMCESPGRPGASSSPARPTSSR
ncbi:MAG: hypothetical protein R3F20_04200 [Planctomycetota bacterium]